MADITKTYVDSAGLTRYDGKIKDWANSISQAGIKTVLKTDDGNTLKFYKKPSATLSDTADFSIDLGSSTAAGQIAELASKMGATWNPSTGHYEFTAFDASLSATTIIGAINEVISDFSTFIGEIPEGSEATTVIGYALEVAAEAEKSANTYTDSAIIALDADLDASGTAQHGGTFVVSGVTEANGVITAVDSVEVESAGAAAALAATLAPVATSGDADDVDYDNTTSGLTATDVQAAIDEVAQASAGGVSSKTVYVTETSGGSSDPFSKRYGVYQGATGSSASPVASEKLIDIDIPKDMVVEDGEVVDIVFKASDNTLHEGSESGPDVTTIIKGSVTPTADDAGKYIKLVVANSSSSALYIKATDLVDIYTTEQGATEIQLAIDNSNVISASVVKIGSNKVIYTNAIIGYTAAPSTYDPNQTYYVRIDDITFEPDTTVTAENYDEKRANPGLFIREDRPEVTVFQALNTLNGSASTSGSVANKIQTAIDALDTSSDVAIASNDTTTGAVTIVSGISETNGIIGAGSGDNIIFTPMTNAAIDALFA